MSVPIESVEARLERQELPVKYEFVRLQNARIAYAEALRGTSANGTTDNDGATVNDGNPPEMSQKKSNNAIKRERAQARKQAGAGLCVSYAQNTCTHGSTCKYSHDLQAYLQSKPPDYPGQCPFSAAEVCPYGIMCRWAGTHKNIDPILKQTVEKGENKMKEDKEKVVEQIGAKVEQNGSKEEEKEIIHAAVGPSATAPVAIKQQDGSAPPSSVFYRMDGTIPSEQVLLTPSSTIAPTTNSVDSHIQPQIRKGKYDFSKADDVLEKLGINNTAKMRELKQGKGPQNKSGPDSAKDGAEDFEVERTKRPRLDPEVVENPAAPPESDAAYLSSLDKKADTTIATTTAAKETTTTAAAAVANPAAAQLPPSSLTDLPPASFYTETPLHPRERKKIIDFRGKTYLAPLTTVGNLPFRRLCKSLGADITCGEMALATNLLQGNAGEWALLKKHPEEDCFGVQLCGGFGDAMARCAQMVEENLKVDFVDVNFGCPIDVVIKRGAGSACLLRPNRMKDIIQSMTSVLNCPVTLKMRKGYTDNQDIAHLLLPKVALWGASAVTLHGRTREQRYSKLADWEYIKTCADVVNNMENEKKSGHDEIGQNGADININTAAVPEASENLEEEEEEHPKTMQLVGNGDVMSWEDHERAITQAGVATTYVARGALIKPWVFTEIKERRHWDISATERLEFIKKFALNGIEHWGSDTRGIENTRRFLLEWLSFAYRYVPVGLLEVVPQKTNQRPPAFVGRNDLETLLASPDPRDWIFISEMVLGPAPEGFRFTPKHKGTSYASTAGGGGGREERGKPEEEF